MTPPEDDVVEEVDLPSPSARVCKTPNEVYPHAALAHTVETSDAATWGTAQSRVGESTTEPDPDDMDDLESMFSDDGDFTMGPIVPTEEVVQDTGTGESDEKEEKHEPDHLHPSQDPDGPFAEETVGREAFGHPD